MKRRAAAASVGLLLALFAGRAEAREGANLVFPGLNLRNGDWLSIDGFGLFQLGSTDDGTPVGPTARVEVGLGGAAAALGVGMGAPPGPCNPGGLVSLEGRVERMYGLTTWRNTTYVGPQLSVSLFVVKASLGWMFDVHDKTDNHLQIGVGVGF